MFTQVFEQGPELQLLAEFLQLRDVPSIMTTNKQVRTDFGNCRPNAGMHCWLDRVSWSEALATRRHLARQRFVHRRDSVPFKAPPPGLPPGYYCLPPSTSSQRTRGAEPSTAAAKWGQDLHLGLRRANAKQLHGASSSM